MVLLPTPVCYSMLFMVMAVSNSRADLDNEASDQGVVELTAVQTRNVEGEFPDDLTLLSRHVRDDDNSCPVSDEVLHLEVTTPRAWIEKANKVTNQYRRMHGAPDLKISEKLCKIAQTWATKRAEGSTFVEHSSYGCTESVDDDEKDPDPEKIMKTWYAENVNWDYSTGGPKEGKGLNDVKHFMNMVSSDLKYHCTVYASHNEKNFVVAEYWPVASKVKAAIVVPPKPGAASVVPPKPGAANVVPPKPAAASVVPPKPGAASVVPPKPGAASVVPPKPGAASVVPPKPGAAGGAGGSEERNSILDPKNETIQPIPENEICPEFTDLNNMTQNISTPSYWTLAVNATTNRLREIEKAHPLVINDRLCQIAQHRANEIASSDTVEEGKSGCGENIWTYHKMTWNDLDKDNADLMPNPGFALEIWMKEKDKYDFDNEPKGDEGKHTKHFTQLVWNSTKVHCVAYAKSLAKDVSYVVAEYWPPGNIKGKYMDNVLGAGMLIGSAKLMFLALAVGFIGMKSIA